MQEHEITSEELPWILFLSGMDGRTWGIEKATQRWTEWYGGKRELLGLQWQKKEYSRLVYETVKVVDNLYSIYGPGLIVGTSAGASMGLRMLMNMRQQVSGLINVNGMVRFVDEKQRKDYSESDKHKIGFYPSVRYMEEEVLPALRDDDDALGRLVVVYSSHDKAVPVDNARIDGAKVSLDTKYWVHGLAIYNTLKHNGRELAGNFVE